MVPQQQQRENGNNKINPHVAINKNPNVTGGSLPLKWMSVRQQDLQCLNIVF